LTAVDGDCYLATNVVWEPFVLAVVMGLVVSAIIYFVVMWPQVEPDEPDEPDEADDPDHPDRRDPGDGRDPGGDPPGPGGDPAPPAGEADRD